MSERIFQAIDFAAEAHRSQVRKDSEIPYVAHPFGVAWILREASCEEEIVIAGLLHDAIEDTHVQPEVIQGQFGARVARVVDACSESDKSLPWITRKERTIDELTRADDDVWAVTAADKLHNALSMWHDYKARGDALWSRFKHGLHHQAWYYGSVAQVILAYAESRPTHDMARRLYAVLEELFDPDFSARWQIHPDQRRFIRVSRAEAEQRSHEAGEGRSWVLAVDPHTTSARIVARNPDGYVTDVQGHEDFFPLEMVFEHSDGFLPGRDWLVATTPNRRSHDGRYRSYFIEWTA